MVLNKIHVGPRVEAHSRRGYFTYVSDIRWMPHVYKHVPQLTKYDGSYQILTF